MKKLSHPLTFKSVAAVGIIFFATAIAWFLLGAALKERTYVSTQENCKSVSKIWGAEQSQLHPTVWFVSPMEESGKKVIQPSTSKIVVELSYEPKKRGLLWNRTYLAEFKGEYTVQNPTPIEQTIHVSFPLPSDDSSFEDFTFKLAGKATEGAVSVKGEIHEAVTIPAGGSVPFLVTYRSRGIDNWGYDLGGVSRIQDFHLTMKTDFTDIDFPEGTSSPSQREEASEGGWNLEWAYPDVIRPQSIGMSMPAVLNPGPITSRISFFAPVSLLFFFTVLLIMGAVRGVNLHPMNYFFLAACFFSFQILFSYLADVLPLNASFGIAAAVSVLLVFLYIKAVAGKELLKIALPAQLAYMVLFSYSFFFDGYSGLTITIGSIATLALLMIATAKVDWSDVFGKRGMVE